MTDELDIKDIGSTVRLASGGPLMTTHGKSATPRDRVICVWQDSSGRPRSWEYERGALILEIMGRTPEPLGDAYEAVAEVGAVRWSTIFRLGDEKTMIYRDGRCCAEATVEAGRNGVTIAAEEISPMVLRLLERELWAVMQEQG